MSASALDFLNQQEDDGSGTSYKDDSVDTDEQAFREKQQMNAALKIDLMLKKPLG